MKIESLDSRWYGSSMASSNYHIVINSTGSGWSLRKEGAARSLKQFPTQREAITHAAKVARDSSTGLFIHRADGMIQEKRSYGHEKSSPRG